MASMNDEKVASIARELGRAGSRELPLSQLKRSRSLRKQAGNSGASLRETFSNQEEYRTNPNHLSQHLSWHLPMMKMRT